MVYLVVFMLFYVTSFDTKCVFITSPVSLARYNNLCPLLFIWPLPYKLRFLSLLFSAEPTLAFISQAIIRTSRLAELLIVFVKS